MSPELLEELDELELLLEELELLELLDELELLEDELELELLLDEELELLLEDELLDDPVPPPQPTSNTPNKRQARGLMVLCMNTAPWIVIEIWGRTGEPMGTGVGMRPELRRQECRPPRGESSLDSRFLPLATKAVRIFATAFEPPTQPRIHQHVLRQWTKRRPATYFSLCHHALAQYWHNGAHHFATGASHELSRSR